MRLQSLKIKGFKSFADETTLYFKDDVIGIVGPNGSGKSNIVDAIRWVLGEQKGKELRLDQMTDVLFNGTKKRKETGMATVALTFDNSDKSLAYEYQTVTISRSLYRSGESEYRINDVLCRLKDIKGLFIDSGISSDSYAIIALGMVDDILADKDNSRRRMFEQAAGISRYKQRKKETLSKLNQTDADLERVKDLLFEIEGNLKTLEKQAKRAKSYYEIKEQYKTDSIHYALIQHHSLREKSDIIEKQILTKQDLFNSKSAALLQVEAELSAVKLKYIQQESLVGEAQKELGKIIASIRQNESEKQLSIQKIGFINQSLKTNKSNLQNHGDSKIQLEKSVQIDRERIVAETSTLKDLTDKFDQLKSEYQAINDDFEKSKSLANQRQLKQQEIQKSIFEQDKELAIIQSKTNTIKNDIQRSTANIQKETADIKSQRESLTEVESLIENRKQELDILYQAEEERKKSISQLEMRLDKSREELAEVNRILDARENEYDLLKSMIDSYEGFPESIRFLHTEWKKNVPVISDVIEVEEKYRAALELYLDSWLNYFVIDTLEEARLAINLLKNAQKGKANFFILNNITAEKNTDRVIVDGIAASSMVKCDQKYRKLIDFLLKDVYIYSGSLDNLHSTGFSESDIVLHENGLFVKYKNSITGGSVGLFEGKKIGRRKSLDELEKNINRNKEKQSKLIALIEQAKSEKTSIEKQNYQSKIEEIKRQIVNHEQEKLRINLKFDNLHNQIQQQQLQIDKWNMELISINEKEKELQKQRDYLTIAFDELMAAPEANSGSLDQLSLRLSEVREQYNQENIKLIRQQNLLDTISRDLTYKENRVLELTNMISEELTKEETLKQQLAAENLVVERLETLLMELSEKRQSVKTGLGSDEQLYFQLRNEISDKEDKIRSESRLINQLQLEINNVKDQLHDIRFKMNSVKERLDIEFSIRLEDYLSQEVDENIVVEDLEERLSKYRNRLQSFGEINPLALEAYDEIKERYELIKSQEKDILEAKTNLMNTIKEIEETATEKFLDSFGKVRENFIMVFRSLFTEEDNCDLILMSPHDPLESEIEIIAKPKGKKPKSLSQLSGGEKTLTATALLFALYLLKPAPFCIFDEVDAPLDDANIEKFNKIIKKFSKESQFIIVTHNKATMAAVDILYGVYMQEQGVTAVTQVDFRSIGNETTLETIS